MWMRIGLRWRGEETRTTNWELKNNAFHNNLKIIIINNSPTHCVVQCYSCVDDWVPNRVNQDKSMLGLSGCHHSIDSNKWPFQFIGNLSPPESVCCLQANMTERWLSVSSADTTTTQLLMPRQLHLLQTLHVPKHFKNLLNLTVFLTCLLCCGEQASPFWCQCFDW